MRNVTSRRCVQEEPPAVRKTLDSGPAALYLRSVPSSQEIPFCSFLFKVTVCFSWLPAAISSWRESVRTEIGECHFGRFLSAMLVVLIAAADIPYCVSNSGKRVNDFKLETFFFSVPLILLTYRSQSEV